ncbi:hypothetical protein [Streptomyces sp. NPDC055709]
MSFTEPGINLYRRWDPGVEAGDYKIQVEQTVTTNPPWKFKPSFDRKFKVGAPYYSLADNDVLARFPPPGSQGAFGNLLPYVSFRDAQLPWERKLDGTDGKPPWLALLVVAEGELDLDDVRTDRASALLGSPPVGVIMPKAPPEEIDQNTACTVADVPVELFAALMPPQPQDLALLAHVREAVDKSPPGSEEPSRVRPACSQVISSRFPRLTSAGEACRYTAHVVSLAGHETSLASLSSLDAGKKIRLISLHSWSFSSTPSTEAGYTEAFDAIQQEAKSGARVRISAPSAVLDVSRRLKAGYVPLAYSLPSGEQTTAWYRGPLAPAPPTEPPVAHEPFTSADGALIYLTKTGMFDISLAAAWTLGCQLVLSRRDLTESMLKWRAGSAARATALALATHPDTAERTLNALPDSDDGRDLDAEGCARLVDPARLRRDFHTAMLDGLGERLTAAMQTPLPATGEREEDKDEDANASAPRTVLPQERPQAPVSLHQHALALLSDEGTGHALRSALTAEFTSIPAATPLPRAPQAYLVNEELTSEADEVRMWEPEKMLALIPTWYLLPLADAVLPENSVRLFHIDTQWLSAFADGMLSIGTHSELDNALTPQLKKVLFQSYTGSPSIACGLLLRSPVLRHWPQEPFSTQEDDLLFTADGAKLVSRRQLGPDAALLLFDKIPKQVILREPAHTLQFGVTPSTPLSDPPKILLRNLDGTAANSFITVDASLYRPAVSIGHSLEVLDIAKAADALKSPLKLTTVGAEHLAFQLLHPPAVLTITFK